MVPLTVALPSSVLPSYTATLSPVFKPALSVPAKTSTASSVLAPVVSAPVVDPLVGTSSVTVVIDTVCVGATESKTVMDVLGEVVTAVPPLFRIFADSVWLPADSALPCV